MCADVMQRVAGIQDKVIYSHGGSIQLKWYPLLQEEEEEEIHYVHTTAGL